jgi:hypothetical protein
LLLNKTKQIGQIAGGAAMAAASSTSSKKGKKIKKKNKGEDTQPVALDELGGDPGMVAPDEDPYQNA